jgi:hypothetical protein
MLTIGASAPELAEDSGMLMLLHRIRSEFLEMPELRLTPAQAARFWAIDSQTSERILGALVLSGFLFRNKNGAYLRVTAA